MKEKLFKTYGIANNQQFIRFLYITLNAQVIYLFWDIRNSFATPLQHVYGFNNKEIGVVFAVQGLGAFFAVFFGWIGTLFPLRKIMLWTSIVVGGISLLISLLAGSISYVVVSLLYILAMLCSETVFNPSIQKAVSTSTDSKHQGAIFSAFDFGRGVIGFVFALIFAVLFKVLGGGNDAMKFIMILSSVLLIGFAVIIYFTIPKVKEDKEIEKFNSQKVKDAFLGLLKVLKFPNVWLVSAIVFCAYSAYAMQTTFYLKYLNDVYKLSTVVVGFIMTGIMFLRPLSNIPTPFLMKKLKIPSATLYIRLLLTVQTCLLLVVIFIPKKATTGPTVLTLSFMLLAMIVGYSLHGIPFSPLGELKELSDEHKTPAMSLAITIGFLPAFLLPFTVGGIVQRYTHEIDGKPVATSEGYIIMFAILITLYVIGILLTTLLEKRKKAYK